MRHSSVARSTLHNTGVTHEGTLTSNRSRINVPDVAHDHVKRVIKHPSPDGLRRSYKDFARKKYWLNNMACMLGKFLDHV
jgi:hypothetical protein